SLSFGIGLATVSGLSLLRAASNAATMLRLHHSWSLLVGTALLGAVGAYALWASLARGKLEIRGWALRAPGAAIGLTQILLGVADLSLSSAVLWSLLPAGAHIGFVSFLGIYAAAVIAGVVSHVPGGVGVFEAVMLLALPGIPPDALLGSLLAYRGVYYLVPLLFATLLFGAKELAGQRPALARAHELASIYVAPVVPQIAGALTFLAGALLLISGATPGIEERLAFLDQFLPLAVLEVSHLGGSLAGLGLLVLARALFRRVQAAYHISRSEERRVGKQASDWSSDVCSSDLDRRRAHVPGRRAAAHLGGDARDRGAARVPRSVPAARGARGVAPRREPRGTGTAGARARAVPPRAGRLPHL